VQKGTHQAVITRDIITRLSLSYICRQFYASLLELCEAKQDISGRFFALAVGISCQASHSALFTAVPYRFQKDVCVILKKNIKNRIVCVI
jgi:hypothetical protein